jgi:putative ABC transport system substrate-binding protein
LVPQAIRVAFLVNPTNTANAESTLKDIQAASSAVGLTLQVLRAATRQEIDAAFVSVARERSDALVVAGDGFFNSRRVQLSLLAARHGVPATYALRDYPEVGGLMSYGTSFPEIYRQVGSYVGRILKGAKPAELPVLQPTKFELVINLQAASVLGLDVPPTLLARADEVIE